MKKRIIFMILGVFSMLASAHVVHAALEITEIMYDPQGTDTNREWVEIHNPDSQPVDLSQWSFWQGGTNHKIHTEAASSSAVIPAQSYAILAHTQADFLADWPQFGGLIFDSSFSLKNSGEEIELKNGDQVVDDVTFDPTVGAGGDGNSLQKNGSGMFIAAPPTPGAAFSGIIPPPSATAAGGQAVQTSPTSSSTASIAPEDPPASSPTDPNQLDLSSFPTTPQILCKISASAAWTVGVQGVVSAAATGLLGEPLQNAQYLWNFGDGSSATDVKVAHTYQEAGQYVISLSVSSGQYSASDRVIISVGAPNISIVSIGENDETAGESLTLENDSASELDLSGFTIRSEGRTFTFPQGSFILAQQKLVLGQATLLMPIGDDLTLSYPNGVLLATYQPNESGGDDDQTSVSTAASPTPAPVPTTSSKTAAAKKKKTSAKVLSAKVSAKVAPDPLAGGDEASDTSPIILSADGDGDSGDDGGVEDVIIFSLVGLGLLGAAAFLLRTKRKKVVTKPFLD